MIEVPIDPRQWSPAVFTLASAKIGSIESMGSIEDCFDNSVIESFCERVIRTPTTVG